MRKIWPFLILAILSLLFLASELILPKVVSKNVEELINSYFENEGEIIAQVKSQPAFNLLRGQVDKLVVEGEKLLLEGLYIDEVTAVIEDLKLKRYEEEWLIEEGEMTGLKMVISEEAINNYLTGSFGQGMPVISLGAGLASLSGYFSILGNQIFLDLEGIFYVKDDRYLCFEPRRLLVEEIQIPAILLKGIFEEIGVQVDLAVFPFPVKVSQVQVGERQLILLTKNY